MSAAPHAVNHSFREIRPPAPEADELRALLAEIEAQARKSLAVVKKDLRKLARSLRDRTKTCHGCATETISERRPKRSQRTFCSEECSQAARGADFRERKRRVTTEPHG